MSTYYKPYYNNYRPTLITIQIDYEKKVALYTKTAHKWYDPESFSDLDRLHRKTIDNAS